MLKKEIIYFFRRSFQTAVANLMAQNIYFHQYQVASGLQSAFEFIWRLRSTLTSQILHNFTSPFREAGPFVWYWFDICLIFDSFLIDMDMSKGKVQKKKLKKNLTSVSSAFIHTYTAVKTNSFRFFPQAYMDNFEKCAKTGNMGTLRGGWGC